MRKNDIHVLKLGGELLEDAPAVRRAAAAIARLNTQAPLVVVHGGGRAIDAELRARGVAPRFVDGLRVTDEATLDTVVSVLAGRANTTLVAAIVAAGSRAVGLTGADGSIGLCERAPELTTVAGEKVDLGLVGQPVAGDATLLEDLLALGYVPVVSSIGIDRSGALLNVNADTLAGHLAGVLRASTLLIAGTTAGVLGLDGNRLDEVSLDDIDAMTGSGTAHSGMVAKLAACRHAVVAGVEHVAVIDGRNPEEFTRSAGTRIVSRAATVVGSMGSMGSMGVRS